MAVRLQVLDAVQWQALCLGQAIETPDKVIASKVGAFLIDKVLRPCIATAVASQEAVQAAKAHAPLPAMDLLLSRWKQIQTLAEHVIHEL